MTEAGHRDNDDFRAEVGAWIAENYPPQLFDLPQLQANTYWAGRNRIAVIPEQELWLQRMISRGWVTPEWPTEYGGGGLSKAQAYILREELQRHGCRKPVENMGITHFGPALLKYGTDAQKLEHLSRISRAEIRWAQGYSEPNAGSDLASLATRAEDKGDHYLVNGSKIWTSYGDKADWMFCLVRTDPDAPTKHQGISMLMFDMTSPGVSTRPITLLSGERMFTQTFFDNLVVPKENLVPPLNGGWEISAYVLANERRNIGNSNLDSTDGGAFEDSVAEVLGAERLAADGPLRSEVLTSLMDAWLLAIARDRGRDEAREGVVTPAFPSLMKFSVTEHNKRRAELAMSIGGLRQLMHDPTGQCANRVLDDWLRSPIYTIAGGSSEIQLNIIAKHALGFPSL